MTATRAREHRIGIRQSQMLRQMARSGGRWPVGWILRGVERQTARTLLRRGWIESLDNPVLTTEGRNIAFWL